MDWGRLIPLFLLLLKVDSVQKLHHRGVVLFLGVSFVYTCTESNKSFDLPQEETYNFFAFIEEIIL